MIRVEVRRSFGKVVALSYSAETLEQAYAWAKKKSHTKKYAGCEFVFFNKENQEQVDFWPGAEEDHRTRRWK